MPPPILRPLRRPPSRAAWVSSVGAFVLGVGASIAANVAHAQPATGARLLAAWAPFALLLTIEVMIRVSFSGSPWLATVCYAAAFVVAAVAAVASYRHMRGLALLYGEDDWTAATLPLSADGLILVSSLALLALARQRSAALPAAARSNAPIAAPTAAPAVAAEPALNAVPDLPAEPAPTAATVGAADPAADAAVPVPAPPTAAMDSAVNPSSEAPAHIGATPPPPSDDAAPADDDTADEPVEVSRPDRPTPVESPDRPPSGSKAEVQALHERAYRLYWEATTAGRTMTGTALGELCNRGARWGRDRIREAKKLGPGILQAADSGSAAA